MTAFQCMRSGGRVVEGARLESEYTAKPYRGFESLPLRHFPVPASGAALGQAARRVTTLVFPQPSHLAFSRTNSLVVARALVICWTWLFWETPSVSCRQRSQLAPPLSVISAFTRSGRVFMSCL